MIHNTELFTTEEQSYLLIHKNACSSIRANLYQEFGDELKFRVEGPGVRWTVVRDPYARFVDAISYDIRVQEVPILWEEKEVLQYIKGINIAKYLANHVAHACAGRGHAPHSVLQTIYLFDNNIDIIVYAEDLKHFIPIHFKDPVPPQNMGVAPHQDIVRKALDSDIELKNRILDLLRVDYITLEHFKTQGQVWSWGGGKIW